MTTVCASLRESRTGGQLVQICLYDKSCTKSCEGNVNLTFIRLHYASHHLVHDAFQIVCLTDCELISNVKFC